MLAPRDKLWSAPAHVVEAALSQLELRGEDTLVDYGCGDGIALLTAAKHFKCRAVGYEIHEERVTALLRRIEKEEPEVRELVSVVCKNALEADPKEPTAVYLYLISRGLKAMLPLLQQAAENQPRGYLRVVSVLYKIPEVPPMQIVKVPTPGREEIIHPIYVYNILPSGTHKTDPSEECVEETTGSSVEV